MKKGRIGKVVKNTQIHIAKNLQWSVLTKIIFFSLFLIIIMDPFIIGLWVEKIHGAKNGGCNPKNGWGRKCDNREALGLFRVILEAAKPSVENLIVLAA